MITKLLTAAERFYAPVGVLGRVLNLAALEKEADAEADRLTERHDVPQGPHVPADLADRAPRYLTTRDGYSIASLLHPLDKTIGSDSAATGLAQASLFAIAMAAGTVVALLGILLALIPIMEVKAAIGVLMFGVMALATLVALMPAIALYQAEKTGIADAAILFALPMLAFAGVGVGVATGALGILGPGVQIIVAGWEFITSFGGGGVKSSLEGFYGVAITLVSVASLIMIPLGMSQFAPTTYKRIRTSFLENLAGPIGALILYALAFVMPLWIMVPLPIAAGSALMVWSFAAKNRKARAQDLMMNSMRFSGFDQNLKAALTRHSPARAKQVESAIKDTSPFIPVGTSLGVLTSQLDGYAPDEGLPFGQTLNDLDTHLLIFGPTGSGKTSGTLRPIIKQVIEARKQVDLGSWKFEERTNPFSIETLLRNAIAAGHEAWLVMESGNTARSVAKKIDAQVKAWSTAEARQRLDAVAPGSTVVVLDKAAQEEFRRALASKSVHVLGALPSPLFGMLMMDGKGALPDEARGASDLTIEPGVPLGLIEGLRIEDLVEAVAGVSGAGAAKSGEGSGSAEFFNSAGREALRHAAALYFAMCEQEERFIENGWVPLGPNGEKPKVNWVKTWAGLTRITQAILQVQRDRSGQPQKAPVIEMIIDFLTTSEFPERRHPQFGKSGLLDQAIAYTNNTLTQDDRTLGNIAATLEQWMSPIMSHSDLLPWASQATGVDPSIVLRGGIVGINVPVFRYGVAGKLIQNLVRLRVATQLRRRSDYPWQAFGQCPVIFLIDEAQEVVTEGLDGTLLPVARSLGGRYVCATQNADSLQQKFGNNGADAVMDQFRSVIGIGMMSPDSAQFIAKRMGNGVMRRWNTQASALPFEHLASMYAGLPFHDKSHPLRPEMRNYLRQGAGVWRNDLEHGASAQGTEDSPASAMAIDDHEIHGTMMRANGQSLPSVSIATEQVYNPSIIDSYLARPNHAVAQVMRGGVIRRDVIRLNPIYTL